MTDKATCPRFPWCTVDHSKQLTSEDGTPLFYSTGRPMVPRHHTSKHEQVSTVMVSLFHSGHEEYEPDVTITAVFAGTAFIPVTQAAPLADVLAAVGVGDLADVIRRTLARLEVAR